MPDVKFHVQVICGKCNWAMEEDTKAVPFLGTVTVLPCRYCVGKAKWQEESMEGKINRRGVMVDERST